MCLETQESSPFLSILYEGVEWETVPHELTVANPSHLAKSSSSVVKKINKLFRILYQL